MRTVDKVFPGNKDRPHPEEEARRTVSKDEFVLRSAVVAAA
jgi:hypothetical protein